MSFIYNVEHTCSFTGHRPDKLRWGKDEVVAWLNAEIKNAALGGYNTFILGMAKGVDIWAAEAVLALRDSGMPIRLVCALPYQGFESGWSSEWKNLYRSVIDRANIVEYICDGYSKICFHVRNRWMVDHSSLVIAVFDGTPGGTEKTVAYAEKKQKCVIKML